jgi:hypothetical protein
MTVFFHKVKLLILNSESKLLSNFKFFFRFSEQFTVSNLTLVGLLVVFF